jgi:hypothetical protein
VQCGDCISQNDEVVNSQVETQPLAKVHEDQEVQNHEHGEQKLAKDTAIAIKEVKAAMTAIAEASEEVIQRLEERLAPLAITDNSQSTVMTKGSMAAMWDSTTKKFKPGLEKQHLEDLLQNLLFLLFDSHRNLYLEKRAGQKSLVEPKNESEFVNMGRSSRSDGQDIPDIREARREVKELLKKTGSLFPNPTGVRRCPCSGDCTRQPCELFWKPIIKQQKRRTALCGEGCKYCHDPRHFPDDEWVKLHVFRGVAARRRAAKKRNVKVQTAQDPVALAESPAAELVKHTSGNSSSNSNQDSALNIDDRDNDSESDSRVIDM